MDLDGILSQLQHPYGILSDPRNAAIAQLGAGLMAQSGPSRMPVRLGQAIGNAALPALDSYRQAEMMRERQLLQALELKRRQEMMAEQARMHNAQIDDYKSKAKQRDFEQEGIKAEREYFANPATQELIRQGKIQDVIAGMPRLTGANMTTLAGVLQKEDKAPMTRRVQKGREWVTEEWNPQTRAWTEIGRGEMDKPASTTVVAPPPVTPVTIQDPDDPNSTIIIDGRTKAVLGKGPKLTEAGRYDVKRQFQMQGLGGIIQKAEDLLSGVKRDESGVVMPGNAPTGSGIGALYDRAAGIVGMSPSGATEAQELKAVSGALVSKMPRMEGPQSDKDVALYREMAAQVGDDTIPIPRRKAALETVKQLWGKYEVGGGQPNPTTPNSGRIKRYNPATGRIE